MAIIEVDHVTKKFKDLIAVKDVTFEVEEGEIFGLLGPNGAGKSTLISILCTLLYSTEGTARVCGFDVNREASKVRENIGIVFQEIILDDLLTGKENLRFFAKIGNMPKIEREQKIDDLLHLVDLYDRKDDIVKNYSGGMKRRLEIARGLLFNPKILFLDEATLGLDAQNRRIIWDYCRRLNKEQSVTILLTSHYIEEAEISNRVAIIDFGKIIELDTPKGLKRKVGEDYIKVIGKTTTEVDIISKISNLDFIKEINKDMSDEYEKYKIYIKNSSEEAIPFLIDEFLKYGFKFKSISDNKPTLEDVFIYYTGRQLRDENLRSNESIKSENLKAKKSGSRIFSGRNDN
ncbi:MAG: ATP-binding cassette domain-containing protein [Candidatus Lokiarchaeota archaeon]|nr:ATP-binding cassette domain-containing protein [Candidatus Lokiarchaeota archaeon]